MMYKNMAVYIWCCNQVLLFCCYCWTWLLFASTLHWTLQRK